MIMTMIKDDVSAQVEALHKKAKEANECGDSEGFFNYARKALDVTKEWIERQQCRQKNLSESFYSSIGEAKDQRQIEIAFGELKLAVKRVEVGLGEPKFDLMKLNKNLLIKVV